MRTIRELTKLFRSNKIESPLSFYTASWLFTMQKQEYELINNKVIEKVIIDGEIWYNIL